MPKQAAPLGQAQSQIEQIAAEMGFALVDVELVREPTGRFLRIYADKEDGITLDDLEALHRRIQPLVEKIDYDFMEVSSPGADRPLKKPEDFVRCAGEEVEIHLYRPINGAKLFRGALGTLKDGHVTVTDASGVEISFDMKQVSLVKPVIEFDEADLEDDIPVDGE